MTHAYEVQTVEVQGIPRIEYQDCPEPTDLEPQVITIEFIPQVHPLNDYGYSQPKFVFGNVVALREQWEHCCLNNINPSEELDYFRIRALELVENKSKTGQLTKPPQWYYGIRCETGTKETIWWEEDELIALEELKQDNNEL